MPENLLKTFTSKEKNRKKRKPFQQLTIDGYKVEFREQLNNKKIRSIIDEVIFS